MSMEVELADELRSLIEESEAQRGMYVASVGKLGELVAVLRSDVEDMRMELMALKARMEVRDAASNGV